MNYFEDEEYTLPTELMDLIDEVENLFNNPPKDKRKRKEVQKWASDLNLRIKMVNQKADFKMYKPIKL